MRKSRYACSFAAALLFVPASAFAEFPEHTINYIIPFGPGGESDVSARLQEPFFKKYSGQSIAIQYKAGAGGAAGWSQLNNMAGDGYTMMGTNLPHIILQPMDKNVGYKTDDLQLIYWFHYTPDALLVPAASKYKTLEEFVNAAKASPGSITVGGTGTKTGNELAKARFDRMADIKTAYIPFKGTGAVNTALLGSQVNASWGYTTVKLQLGDQVRCLAVALEERHPAIPDCPTFKELGYDLIGGVYRGLAVPKSTPEDKQAALADIIRKINADPEFIKKMENSGFTMVDIGPDEMKSFMDKTKAELQAAAQDLGIKPH
ncbi:tripartite tricarboxylate transporter substrate binding protein [Allopusillimonas ginsengisoli]|nr:tripartite tricarboxylate transporter substrate binding protein [Allopusillimonas ginsengisoli]